MQNHLVSVHKLQLLTRLLAILLEEAAPLISLPKVVPMKISHTLLVLDDLFESTRTMHDSMSLWMTLQLLSCQFLSERYHFVSSTTGALLRVRRPMVPCERHIKARLVLMNRLSDYKMCVSDNEPSQ